MHILQYQFGFPSIVFDLKAMKRVLYQFDMFCSSQLLRYRSQAHYKTLTGGIFSLIIICVVAAGFAKMVGETLQRTAITSSLITQKYSSPPLFELKTGSEGMFMMGFAITSFDFSISPSITSGQQYFSFRLKMFEVGDELGSNVTSMNLEQCNRQHWKMVPQFLSNFDKFGVQNWLCLPAQVTLPLQGSFTTDVLSFAAIEVAKCSNFTSNNTCAPQEEIDSLFQRNKNFYLNFYYVNPVINSNQQDYLSYYVEGKDYVLFSTQIGSQAWIYLSEYTITTDDSIFPYIHTTQTNGCIIQQKIVNQQYSIPMQGADNLVLVYLGKSENLLRYTRQVQKLSVVVSHIGGLVGAITAVLFLIKSYTDTSLEVAIGLSLFEASKNNKDKEGQKEKQKKEQDKNFNFFEFLRLIIYRLLRFCGCMEAANRQEYLRECQEQAIKQMDIELLLKRIIKLETCISNFFTSQSLQRIKEEQPITLNSAKKMRLLLLKQQAQYDNTSKEGQIKDKIHQEDVDGGRNSNIEGLSHVESVTPLKNDHSNASKKSSLIRSQKQQAPIGSLIQGCQKEKVPNFWTIQKRQRNRVQPENPLPPLRRGILRFIQKNV